MTLHFSPKMPAAAARIATISEGRRPFSLYAPGWARSPIVKRALPFALFILVLAMRGFLPDGAALPGDMDARWLYGVQAAVALVPIVIWWRGYAELQTAPRSLRSLAISIAIGLLVFAVWVAPMPQWAHLAGQATTFVPLDADGQLRWDLIAMRTFGAVLVVPVMEELFWRSFLMRWIDKRDFLQLTPAATTGFALVAASAVFALAHDLWLAGGIAGIAYGLAYRRLGNLWYAIIGHATTNLALAVWVVHGRAWSYW
jgi:CAAX prenyl protease-like protein